MEVEFREEVDLEGRESPFGESEPGTSNMKAGEETSEQRFKFQKVVGYLREELQLSGGTQSTTALDIPVFVGHGQRTRKCHQYWAKKRWISLNL